MLAATTEAEVGASKAEAAELEWEDAYATWRVAARKATRDIATVELEKTREQTVENALTTSDARRTDLQATVDGTLAAFLATVEARDETILHAPAAPAATIHEKHAALFDATHEACEDDAEA